ncbi:MAG TPA: hypothetical protein VKT82_06080 [Ktedonobacterales bacterium]|nr:hypothetical protein [Ktedonobacterales bacterium]
MVWQAGSRRLAQQRCVSGGSGLARSPEAGRSASTLVGSRPPDGTQASWVCSLGS